MRLTGLLLVGLGLWFLWQHGSDVPVGDERQTQRPDFKTRLPDDPDQPAISEYVVILKRPLFSPHRRPPVKAEPEPQPTPAPRIRLSAITISNSVRVAVIRELDSNQTRHIREGDKLNDWVVEKVGPNSVILTTEDRKITIPLFDGG